MGCTLQYSGAHTEALDAYQQAEKIFDNSLAAQRGLVRTLYRQPVSEDALAKTAEAETSRCRARSLRTALTGEKRVDQQSPKGFDELVIYIHA